MNARKSIAFGIASLGLALAAQASFAAGSHVVTQGQIDQIQAGASATEVAQKLGAPENTTRWMSGARSMVYEQQSANDQAQLVYVDLDRDNKVTDVAVIGR